MSRAELLALLDYVVALLESCECEEAAGELRKLRVKLAASAWDEILRSI